MKKLTGEQKSIFYDIKDILLMNVDYINEDLFKKGEKKAIQEIIDMVEGLGEELYKLIKLSREAK